MRGVTVMPILWIGNVEAKTRNTCPRALQLTEKMQYEPNFF